MRVALISDLHGNQVSLSAVLEDIDRRGVDEVVCLGDVATLGARPNDVLETLAARGIRCILGNHDAFMIDEELIRTYTEVPIVVEAVDWCRDQLSQDEVSYLAKFQASLRIDLGPNTSALLFHGSPRSHMEDLLATTDASDLDEALGDASATVMAGGHTHLQLLRQHRGNLLVNPGSVGMPFREFPNGCTPKILPFAEYAVIEANGDAVEVHLRRVGVDKHLLYKQAAGCPNPICRSLELQYS
ncbi:MAG TPA: metallophosphoesterase family protein [Candidatus Binatia bacterium]|jgi:predicted phosphodiesterase